MPLHYRCLELLGRRTTCPNSLVDSRVCSVVQRIAERGAPRSWVRTPACNTFLSLGRRFKGRSHPHAAPHASFMPPPPTHPRPPRVGARQRLPYRFLTEAWEKIDGRYCSFILPVLVCCIGRACKHCVVTRISNNKRVSERSADVTWINSTNGVPQRKQPRRDGSEFSASAAPRALHANRLAKTVQCCYKLLVPASKSGAELVVRFRVLSRFTSVG